jgi:hypothetical protein
LREENPALVEIKRAIDADHLINCRAKELVTFIPTCNDDDFDAPGDAKLTYRQCDPALLDEPRIMNAVNHHRSDRPRHSN